MTAEPLITIERLSKRFPIDRHHYVGAVNDVSFAIGKGETLGLVGESGSGKTTVGRCVLRLVGPTSGQIVFRGAPLSKLAPRELRALRAKAQLVFQDPLASLNPRRTARQTIEEPLTLQTKAVASQRAEKVLELAGLVGLSERRLNRFPGELTGSEQQRVGIARALITDPDLIVLDEPTSALDPIIRREILDVLARIQRTLGVSYLFISHDLTAVERLSQRVAVMYLGRLIEVGETATLMREQFHPYTRALLSATLSVDPEAPRASQVIRGEIPSAINPKDECPFIGRCPIRIDACRRKMPDLVDMGGGHFSACLRAEALKANEL